MCFPRQAPSPTPLLAGGIWVNWTAGLPRHKKELGDQNLETREKNIFLSFPSLYAKPSSGYEWVFLDSHLREQEGGAEKAQVRNQGFQFVVLSRDSFCASVVLGTLSHVGCELWRGKGEAVLAVSLEHDLLLSAIASACRGSPSAAILDLKVNFLGCSDISELVVSLESESCC